MSQTGAGGVVAFFGNLFFRAAIQSRKMPRRSNFMYCAILLTVWLLSPAVLVEALYAKSFVPIESACTGIVHVDIIPIQPAQDQSLGTIWMVNSTGSVLQQFHYHPTVSKVRTEGYQELSKATLRISYLEPGKLADIA